MAEEPAPTPPDASTIDDLVAKCIAALETEGAAAVDRICAENASHAEQIRQRLEWLGHRDLLAVRKSGEPRTLEPGRRLGPYEIVSHLGAGAMGEVYHARDTKLSREVAIKVLPADFAADHERVNRFEREARSLAALNHPNIAQIYSVDRVDGVQFLALEFVPGETLSDRLARGVLRPEEALRICRDVAEGLENAHEAGVIHRDLKPANIRVTPEGVAKVLDFGLAKTVHQEAEASTEDSSLQTRSGAVVGTPSSMGMDLVFEGKVEEALAANRKALTFWPEDDDDPNQVKAKQAVESMVAMLTKAAKREKRLLAVARGEGTVDSAKDWFAAAHFANEKKDHLAVARTYARGFAAFPDSAREKDHAYKAARAAVLAASGQGPGSDKLTDGEKQKLRNLALDWLTADLKRWREAASGGNRTKAISTLQGWQADKTFAHLRDELEVMWFPEKEGAKWLALWADVGKTLKGWEAPKAP
jgi:tRNA A-37 threonylcarbamoyl transferase component Bud32